MTDRLIQTDKTDGITILTMSYPPANCYTYDMMRQLDEAILDARMDTDTHVILLRGDGDKFFSAGADIHMLASVTPSFKYFFCLHANETLNRLEHTPKLVIAALNGHTVGGGLEIALACDLRIAKRNAGKIGLPEVTLGVLPGTGGTQRLARLLGKSKAMELMVTGRVLPFEEAEEIGLIHQVFDADHFMDDVLAYARQFVPPNKASLAVGRIKRAVQVAGETSFIGGLCVERELQQQLFQSSDGSEGLRAWLEKRQAEFRGC